MNILFTPNEINAIADQVAASILARLDAAAKQATRATQPAFVQLTVQEVAKQLQLSEKTIHKYLKEGRLRGNNIGTVEKPLWRISQQAVQDFVAA